MFESTGGLVFAHLSRAPKKHTSKNKDRDIPYNPPYNKANKVGISLKNPYAYVLLGVPIEDCAGDLPLEAWDFAEGQKTVEAALFKLVRNARCNIAA